MFEAYKTYLSSKNAVTVMFMTSFNDDRYVGDLNIGR